MDTVSCNTTVFDCRVQVVAWHTLLHVCWCRRDFVMAWESLGDNPDLWITSGCLPLSSFWTIRHIIHSIHCNGIHRRHKGFLGSQKTMQTWGCSNFSKILEKPLEVNFNQQWMYVKIKMLYFKKVFFTITIICLVLWNGLMLKHFKYLTKSTHIELIF